MSGEEMKQPVCNCGKVLTAEEILYYSTTCEQCEEAFTVAMQNDAMGECPIDASCSQADKFEAAKAAYIKLTNNQDSIDPETGKFYYSADSEIMDALHEFFMCSL